VQCMFNHQYHWTAGVPWWRLAAALAAAVRIHCEYNHQHYWTQDRRQWSTLMLRCPLHHRSAKHTSHLPMMTTTWDTTATSNNYSYATVIVQDSSINTLHQPAHRHVKIFKLCQLFDHRYASQCERKSPRKILMNKSTLKVQNSA